MSVTDWFSILREYSSTRFAMLRTRPAIWGASDSSSSAARLAECATFVTVLAPVATCSSSALWICEVIVEIVSLCSGADRRLTREPDLLFRYADGVVQAPHQIFD